jgi:DNA-binding NarL/FixJ family response regulator
LIRGIPDTFFPTVRPARRAAPAAPNSKQTRKPFRLSTARFAPPSPKPTVTTISKCSLLQLTTLLSLGQNERRAGFSLLAHARTKFPNAPAAILTFHDDPRLTIEASTLGGFLLSKQDVPDCLDAFATHVQTVEARRQLNFPSHVSPRELEEDGSPESGHQPLDPIDIADPAYALTSAELALVEAILMGMEPKTYRTVRRVALATYKTQVSSILRKTGTKSLLSLISRVRKTRGT